MTDAPTPAKHARPHLTTHSRAQGHSSVAGAAYRLGLKLTDLRTGKTHDFRKRKVGDEIVHAVTIAPPGAPEWATDPQELWNRVEASEHRKDAQVARDYRVPIPRGLTDEQARDLAVDLARHIANALGTPVSLGLHRDAERDALGMVKPAEKQGFHAHLYFPTRALDSSSRGIQDGENATGFGPKLEMLSNKKTSAAWVESFNAKWADTCNRYLISAGKAPAIDHRSYRRQGIAETPQPKVGQAATALERKGVQTMRGDLLRAALNLGEAHQKAKGTAHEAKRLEVGATLTTRILARRQHLGITQERQTMPQAIVTPRPVSPRPRSKVRTHVGYQPSLADKIRAAARPPKNDAERQALERAIAFAHLLDEALRACLTRIREHLVWREQAEQARVAARDLEDRIEASRTRMMAARMKVDALMLRHPIRVRLASAGIVKDPTDSARGRASLHHRHVLEDSKTLKELRGKVAIARGRVRRHEKTVERLKESVRHAATILAGESVLAYNQALKFLPDESAALVLEVMTRPRNSRLGQQGDAGGDVDGQRGGGRGNRSGPSPHSPGRATDASSSASVPQRSFPRL